MARLSVSDLRSWMLVIAAVTGYLLIAAAIRATASSGIRQRISLIGIRLGLCVCLAIILTELTIAVPRRERPLVIFLVDESASMGIADTARIQTRTDLPSDSRHDSRSATARFLLEDISNTLADAYRIQAFGFSGGLRMLDAERIAAPESTDRHSLRPVTRPASAVRQIIDESRRDPPLAIVMLSDGIDDRESNDTFTHAGQLARDAGIPVLSISIGGAEPIRDIDIPAIRTPERMFVGDADTAQVTVRVRGIAGGSITVTVTDYESGDQIVSGDVSYSTGDDVVLFEFDLIAEQSGVLDYQISVDVHPDEQDPTNNTDRVRIPVERVSGRVLLVDRTPRRSWHYLKELLARQSAEEGIVELHAVLMDADDDAVAQDAQLLPLGGRFPDLQALLSDYDVIVLGDVDPATLAPHAITGLRTFVGDHGGGLILVAGAEHNPASWANTALADVLPIDPDHVEVPGRNDSLASGFHPRLTVVSQEFTPLFRIGTAAIDLESLAELHDWYWMVRAPVVRAGATVLVEHSQPEATGDALPLVVIQQFGAGTVVFHATDDMWLWRFRGRRSVYASWWHNLIRFSARNRIRNDDRLELSTNVATIDSGDVISLQLLAGADVEFPDQTGDVTVDVMLNSQKVDQVRLRRRPVDAGYAFSGMFRPLVPGHYHAQLVEPQIDSRMPETGFRVRIPTREIGTGAASRQSLKQMAAISGGRSFESDESSQLIEELRQRTTSAAGTRTQPFRVWNRPELLLLIVVLLVADWQMRSRLHG